MMISSSLGSKKKIMTASNRKPLFSVTKTDCTFIPYKGTGAGGQKKNKTSSAMRCVHKASGAVGLCENYREQSKNKKESFLRMSKTKVFQAWVKMEASRQSGELAAIDDKVSKMMNPKNIKVEVKEKGLWVPED